MLLVSVYAVLYAVQMIAPTVTGISCSVFEFESQPPSKPDCNPYSEYNTPTWRLRIGCEVERVPSSNGSFDVHWFKRGTDNITESLGRLKTFPTNSSNKISSAYGFNLLHDSFHESMLGDVWCQVVDTSQIPNVYYGKSNVLTILHPDEYNSSLEICNKIIRNETSTCADIPLFMTHQLSSTNASQLKTSTSTTKIKVLFSTSSITSQFSEYNSASSNIQVASQSNELTHNTQSTECTYENCCQVTCSEKQTKIFTLLTTSSITHHFSEHNKPTHSTQTLSSKATNGLTNSTTSLLSSSLTQEQQNDDLMDNSMTVIWFVVSIILIVIVSIVIITLLLIAYMKKRKQLRIATINQSNTRTSREDGCSTLPVSKTYEYVLPDNSKAYQTLDIKTKDYISIYTQLTIHHV